MLYRLIVVLMVVLLFSTAVLAEEASPLRIVSLAPSMTEMLYALGLEDRIVGVTDFCDFPPEAKEKPKIGGMSNPSLEAVVSLKPDIVMMTTNGNSEAFEERLRSLGVKTYVLRERSADELPGSVSKLGRALGVEERADAIASEMKETIEHYRKLGNERKKKQTILKALFIIWPEPLMVAGPGSVIEDVLVLLGYENIASGAKMNYPKYSIEEAIRRGPDVIFIGSGHENMVKLSEKLLGRLKSTPAVKNGNVFFVSDNLYRFGPRVIEGMKEINSEFKNMNSE
jgi:iron complex transport system substrate-binding protein